MRARRPQLPTSQPRPAPGMINAGVAPVRDRPKWGKTALITVPVALVGLPGDCSSVALLLRRSPWRLHGRQNRH
jgi:hypothetical protein